MIKNAHFRDGYVYVKTLKVKRLLNALLIYGSYFLSKWTDRLKLLESKYTQQSIDT